MSDVERMMAEAYGGGHVSGTGSQWRPIATAPKDLTEILTCRRGRMMAVAMWVNTSRFKGWTCVDGARLLNVTHWMPLPEPPQ